MPLLTIISAVKRGAMKSVLAVAVPCVVALSLAAAESATRVEDEIKKLEQDWTLGGERESVLRTKDMLVAIARADRHVEIHWRRWLGCFCCVIDASS